MKELFFEIYGEEIPARMQIDASKQLKILLDKILNAYGIKHSPIETYVTPQRLIALINEIEEKTEEKTEKIRGPRSDSSKDIVSRFLESKGAVKAQLIEENGYFYINAIEKAQDIKDVLPEIIQKILTDFHWIKTMRWPASDVPWIRPIHSIYCVLGGAIFDFEINLLKRRSGKYVTGHRFMNKIQSSPTTFEEYKKFLKEHNVIIDHLERQEKIKNALNELGKKIGIIPDVDQSLLEENAGLCEWIYTVIGKIDNQFMDLPSVILKTAMKKHQKYFGYHNENGDLQPYFGTIWNIEPKDPTKVLGGYEKILRARLADARFFYETDVSIPLEKHKLDTIIFHESLGSIEQKSERLMNLMSTAPGKIAANLCKRDLSTTMVGEFPELQGIMGGIYARKQGIAEGIAVAISEHYFPHGPSTPCPSTQLGSELALLDKLDSLVGFLGKGAKISGSKDPLGLRRNALGIIRIYETGFIKTELCALIKETIIGYAKQDLHLSDETEKNVITFIEGRLSIYLHEEKNYSDNLVKACVGFVKLEHIFSRIEEMKNFIESGIGKEFLNVFKRLLGLLKSVPEGLSLLQPKISFEIQLADYLNGFWNFETLKKITPILAEYFDEVLIFEGVQDEINQRLLLLHLLYEKTKYLGNFKYLI